MPRLKLRPLNRPIDPINITLLPKQLKLIKSQSRIVGYIGGYGSGKSFGGAAKALRLAIDNVGLEGMIVSASYKMLHRVTLSSFLQLAQPLVQAHHKQEARIDLINGSRIWYGSADTPGSLEGSNLAWFWGDEARLWSYEAYRILLGRLRVARAKLLQGVITTTPAMGWLREEFDSGKDREIIRSSSRENWYLDDKFIDDLLESYSEAQAKAYIDGEWVVLEGVIFPEFDTNYHIIDYTPDPSLPVIAGLDFGYRWPAVVYGQILTTSRQIGMRKLPEGSLIIFDEDVTDHISTESLAMRIAERFPSTGKNHLEWIACDPAGSLMIQAASEKAGITDAIALKRTLNDQGINPRVRYVTGKGSAIVRSVNTGIEKTRAKLRNAKGETKLYFARNLLKTNSYRGLIKSLGSYQYKHGTPHPLRGEPAGQVDHVVDALRYLVRHLDLAGPRVEQTM